MNMSQRRSTELLSIIGRGCILHLACSFHPLTWLSGILGNSWAISSLQNAHEIFRHFIQFCTSETAEPPLLLLMVPIFGRYQYD